jgi:enoyl-CoA hydratase
MIFDAPEPIDYSRYRELKLSLDDGVMTVTLSNPGKRNAVTMRMAEELSMIWEDVWADTNVRAAILTGDGGDFCAGADVSQLSQASTPDAAAPVSYVHRATRHGRKHVMGIIECEKPVIAKIRAVSETNTMSQASAMVTPIP